MRFWPHSWRTWHPIAKSRRAWMVRIKMMMLVLSYIPNLNHFACIHAHTSIYTTCRNQRQSPLKGSCCSQGRSRQDSPSQGCRSRGRSSLLEWSWSGSSAQGHCQWTAGIGIRVFKCRRRDSSGRCHEYLVVVTVHGYAQCCWSKFSHSRTWSCDGNHASGASLKVLFQG